MEKAVSYIYEKVLDLERKVSMATYIAGGAMILCYILNKQIKKLNKELIILQEKE